MAKNPGTLVVDTIRPYDTEDPFPTHDDRYGKGGFRVVQTLAERNAITAERRTPGMLVFVLENRRTYSLTEDEANWEPAPISFSIPQGAFTDLQEGLDNTGLGEIFSVYEEGALRTYQNDGAGGDLLLTIADQSDIAGAIADAVEATATAQGRAEEAEAGAEDALDEVRSIALTAGLLGFFDRKSDTTGGQTALTAAAGGLADGRYRVDADETNDDRTVDYDVAGGVVQEPGVLVPQPLPTPYLNLNRFVAPDATRARQLLADPDIDTVVFDARGSLVLDKDIAITPANGKKRIIVEPHCRLVPQDLVADNSYTNATGTRTDRAVFFVTAPDCIFELHGDEVDMSDAFSNGGNRMLMIALNADGLRVSGSTKIFQGFDGLHVIDTNRPLIEGIHFEHAVVASPNACVELTGVVDPIIQNLSGKNVEEVLDFNANVYNPVVDGLYGEGILQNVFEPSNSIGTRARNVCAYNCSPLHMFDYVPDSNNGGQGRFPGDLPTSRNNRVHCKVILDEGWTTAGVDLIALETLDQHVEIEAELRAGSTPLNRLVTAIGGAQDILRGRPAEHDYSTYSIKVRGDVAPLSHIARLNGLVRADIIPNIELPNLSASSPCVLVSRVNSPDAATEAKARVVVREPRIIDTAGADQGTGINIQGSVPGRHAIIGPRTYEGLAVNEGISAANTQVHDPSDRILTIINGQNPPSLGPGEVHSVAYNIPGARLGMRCEVTFNQDLTGGLATAGIDIKAKVVNDTDTANVLVVWKHEGEAGDPNINLPSGTVRLEVFPS